MHAGRYLLYIVTCTVSCVICWSCVLCIVSYACLVSCVLYHTYHRQEGYNITSVISG